MIAITSPTVSLKIMAVDSIEKYLSDEKYILLIIEISLMG